MEREGIWGAWLSIGEPPAPLELHRQSRQGSAAGGLSVFPHDYRLA